MKYTEASRDLITERVPPLPLALYVNVYDGDNAFFKSFCREFK